MADFCHEWEPGGYGCLGAEPKWPRDEASAYGAEMHFGSLSRSDNAAEDVPSA